MRVTLAAAAAMLALAAPAEASLVPRHVHAAAVKWFGKSWRDAEEVARCETGGTYSVYARNGQYRGVWQMGSWERRTYGDGITADAQARAASAYWRASGRDWSPWVCKP